MEEYQLFKHLQAGTKQAAPLNVLPIPTYQVTTVPDSSHHASRSKEIMVGKQDEFDIIKEMLIQHPYEQLEIVSIKGMGGIGKTTLDDSSITSYFDKRAWTVASQHHNKRQMLLDLLDSKHDADKRSDGDLALQLYQSFKKCQRYLVVIDDIWSAEAWYAVKTCFPDDGNGSRVLLTTRFAEVANHICIKDNFSHQMQLLEQRESWQLFYEKTCKSRGAEFETIGRPVVEKCKGLPLAIILVAGLFSKLNTLDEWKNTANALSSSSATTLDDKECLRILLLSYNHLPHNLKACFLYLGVFPEDHEIKTNNLARLWLAKGLVKTFENESFDAMANRKLALYGISFEWEEINILSKLPRLDVLKLRWQSCSIKLRACRHSAVELAKKIQDEQRDYGNYDMVLIEEETLYVINVGELALYACVHSLCNNVCTVQIYKVPFHIEIDLELARITASNSS
ncbi:disease resistance protein RPP13-like [Ipomoea triloba]|uniref:disease resistance protein RPP13-like n=1 Tax=Ipomoea triloba TaxID=35885 RepID=UPI00125DB679|nr:disease resistance protein RPP13-like [Ipomoea triloba]